jgi:hypothetical protein
MSGQGALVIATDHRLRQRLPEPSCKSLLPSQDDSRANNHHRQEPKEYPEAGLAELGLEEVEHLENQE